MLCMDCSAETMSSRLLTKSQSCECFDDNAETIRQQIEIYYQATEPVIAYYEKKTQLCKVNCSKFELSYCSFLPLYERYSRISDMRSFMNCAQFLPAYSGAHFLIYSHLPEFISPGCRLSLAISKSICKLCCSFQHAAEPSALCNICS